MGITVSVSKAENSFETKEEACSYWREINKTNKINGWTDTLMSADKESVYMVWERREIRTLTRVMVSVKPKDNLVTLTTAVFRYDRELEDLV